MHVRRLSAASVGLALVASLLVLVASPARAEVGPPPVVTTTTLPPAEVGIAYDAHLAFEGAATDPVWTVEDGSLPAGISLGPDGELSGMPEAAGTATFTVGVTGTDGQTGTAPLTIEVQAPIAVDESVPDGTPGYDLSIRLGHTGGVEPLTWELLDSTYPGDPHVFTFSDHSNSYLLGPAAPSGTYTFSVRVTDALGATATGTLSFRVLPETPPPAPILDTTTIVAGGATLAWRAALGTGGYPITDWVVTPIADGVAEPSRVLPNTSTSHYASATITGLTLGASYTFSVAATNQLGTGPASNLGGPVTVIDPVRPIASVGVGGTLAKPTFVWTASVDAGHPVTGFDVGFARTETGALVLNHPVGPDVRSYTTNESAGTVWYTVRAKNALGPGAWSERIPVTTHSRPGAPVIAVAGVIADGHPAARVTWTAPTWDGYTPITGYRVLIRDKTSPTWDPDATYDVGPDARELRIDDVEVGHAYWVWVVAVNAVGDSNTSDGNSSVDFALPVKPAFPSVQPGNATARLSWWAPSATSFPITQYVITPSLDGVVQAPQTFTAPTAGVTLTGLSNGGRYTFSIVARSALGDSPAATVGPVVVGTPTAPAYPAALPGATSMRVAWQPSTANGSPVLGYRITPVKGGVDLPTVDTHSAATTYTIPGLVAGDTYLYKVVAYNAAGSGPSASTPATMVGTPGPPGYISAAPGLNPSDAQVRFYAPTGNGLPITGYHLEVLTGGSLLSEIDYPASSTLLTVGSLTVGKAYQFRVRAVNAIGRGPVATSNTVVVGTPLAPLFPSAQPGSASARLAWTAAPTNGFAPTSYQIIPFVGSTAQPARIVTAPATTATVTGLGNGTTYTFKVVAVNQWGASLATAVTTPVVVGAPTQPAWPSAKPGDRSAIVAAGAATANGSPVTGYVVTPMVGTTAKPSQTFAGTSTTWSITGLANGTTYTFRVAAINAYGTGPYATTAAVKVGTPSAPTNVKAVAGVRAATVSWTAPSGNGSPITGYLVTPYAGSVARPTELFDASALSRTITGLTSGTAYTFKVQAVNGLGPSLLSSASGSVTPT